jgi:hypothetical protein
MNETDDSHDVAALSERLQAARATLRRQPLSTHRDGGPVDPATGESWHRGNVLGHMSEMLSYWTDQIRRAKDGSGTVGRDEAGTSLRRKGIDRGNTAAEAVLKLAVDEEVGRALEMMEELSHDDLERKVAYHSRAGDREARLGELLQMLIVSHVEEHVAQLASLA